MLFKIHPDLPQSQVFDGLNRFLKETMVAALEGRAVNDGNLPVGMCAALAANPPTRDAVGALVASLEALEQSQKNALLNSLAPDTDPCTFLCDRNIPLPDIPDLVLPPLKKLAAHLFQRTSKLSGVEHVCGERVDDHFSRFRQNSPPGNGNVCCACGTQYLAQIQAGLDDNEQWRGPYDHLLAKDKYPQFGVHPRNLIPICDTCNSKAKLAKDLLLSDGVRRLSFLPWTEHALTTEIRVSISEIDGLLPRVVVDFIATDQHRQEKLNTWDAVYKIKARVEGEFTDLREKVAEDVSVSSRQSFLESLDTQAQAKLTASRRTPFSYWRSRVYQALGTMPPDSQEAFRSAIAESMPSRAEIEELFFA